MAVIEQSYAHRLADAMQATGADDETIVSWSRNVRRLADELERLRPKRGRKVAQLTDAQLDAALQALNHVIDAADYNEQVEFFGSPSAVRTAVRAQDELRRARYGRG